MKHKLYLLLATLPLLLVMVGGAAAHDSSICPVISDGSYQMDGLWAVGTWMPNQSYVFELKGIKHNVLTGKRPDYGTNSTNAVLYDGKGNIYLGFGDPRGVEIDLDRCSS